MARPSINHEYAGLHATDGGGVGRADTSTKTSAIIGPPHSSPLPWTRGKSCGHLNFKATTEPHLMSGM
jgi:hypothetical protein